MTKCKKCGKEIKPTSWHKRVYCSDECRIAYYHKTDRANAKCEICGNPLSGRQKKYCSFECKRKFMSKYQQEKNKELYKSTIPKALPKRRRKKSAKWAKELAEFNAKARALGLSYGQYVGKSEL